MRFAAEIGMTKENRVPRTGDAARFLVLNAEVIPITLSRRNCAGSVRYSSGRATRKPTTLRREPLGKFMRDAGRANSAS
jgi:hypothetical protein